MQLKLHSESASARMFAVCWILYAASYIGRINYSVALLSMIRDTGMEKSQAGIIGTAFFICYGFGQFVSGMLGDRISPFKMIAAGFLGTILTNIGMSLGGSLPVLAGLWGLCGLFQSMLWPPVLTILSGVLVKTQRAKALTRISSSGAAGTVAAYLLSMLLIRAGSWRLVFLATGIILFLVLCACVVVMAGIRGAFVPAAPAPPQEQSPEQRPAASLIRLLTGSGVVIILVPVLLHGMVKEGINVWVPTMISEVFDMQPSFSAGISMLLPIAGIGGAYGIMWLFHRFFQGDESLGTIATMATALPMLVFLLMLDRLPLPAAILLLAFVSASMSGFNQITVTLLPTRFKRFHRVSSMTGLINSVTYAGSAAASYLFGIISGKFGWNAVIFICLIAAGTGAAFCVWFIFTWKRRRRSFLQAEGHGGSA